jgi:hypothetical protein
MDIKSGGSHSWHSRVVAVLSLSVVCLSAYFIGSWLGELAGNYDNRRVDNSTISPAPALFIEPAELNLGEVWEEPDFTTTVWLRNTSDHDVSISKFATGCDCLGIEPVSPVVPANGSIPLRVKIDLTRRLPYAWGVERRPFTLTVHPIVTQAGVAPSGWEFTAVVRSRVTLSDLRLEFADKCTHAGPVITRKVEATAHLLVASLETMVQPRIADVQIKPILGPPGKYDIIVMPDPKLPVGPFSFEILIIAVMPDGVRNRCATIQVTGEMQPATRVVPSIVILGEHPVGSEAAAEVSVRLPERSGWVVDHVEVESPQLNVFQIGTFKDETLRYRLVQRITKRGDQESKVRFIIRQQDGTHDTVETDVRYHGAATGKQKNKEM